jgi:hypothetical protein
MFLIYTYSRRVNKVIFVLPEHANLLSSPPCIWNVVVFVTLLSKTPLAHASRNAPQS